MTKIEMQELIIRLTKIEHGFRPFELEALNIFKVNSIHDSNTIAIELFESEFYQIRSVAVFIWGYIASNDLAALQLLRTKVSVDKSWQVQEILAKAFDQFCNDNGYENSLTIIKDWLTDTNTNVCRAVTEGLRIWTGRPYFNAHPEVAIHLISQHKSSESEYLRKSVGNSLRDISKKHKMLIDNELSTWNLEDKKTMFTYKLLMKNRS